MFRGIRLAAVSAALVPLLLAGCSAPSAAPAPAASAPTPTASATPAFASKEEAFAAAEKVYKRYLKYVDDATTAQSRAAIRKLPSVAGASLAAQVEASIKRAKLLGVHPEGYTLLQKFEPQSVNPKTGEVRAYVCVDLKAVRLINAKGKDVTSQDRPDLQQFLAGFDSVNGTLVVTREAPWDGGNVC